MLVEKISIFFYSSTIVVFRNAPHFSLTTKLEFAWLKALQSYIVEMKERKKSINDYMVGSLLREEEWK